MLMKQGVKSPHRILVNKKNAIQNNTITRISKIMSLQSELTTVPYKGSL